MVVLIVLLISWVVLRGIGAAGVHVLASWQHSALYALAVMFNFTATAHFNKMKHDLARMIPAYFPRPMLLVYITGFLELLGAVGLILPEFRRLAGICLIALLIGMFIANVNTTERHASRQTANAALVAGSVADFVCCASLVVNSCLRASFHSPESRSNSFLHPIRA